MGSCMSKGKNKKKFKDEGCNYVDDKLVISQASSSPCPLLANIALSPSKSPASITSTSSLSSSISCTSSEFSITSSISSISSSSSSSSWSSSVLSSKERSFSNEFLRSCAKENPHIIGLDPIRESSEKSSMSKRIHPRKIESSPSKRVLQLQQSINQERLHGSTPKKRARNSSPIVVRQKSLRKDLDRVSSSNNLPSRAMSSPSPSRRFNMESPRRVSTNATKECHFKVSMASKVNNVHYGASASVKKDVVKPISANHDLNRRCSSFKSKETTIQQIDAKIAETTIGEMQAKKDLESILMEDINNPHIALDCFIFL